MGITHLQRIGIGLPLSILATAVAALVEVKRKSVATSSGLLDSTEPLPITLFWIARVAVPVPWFSRSFHLSRVIGIFLHRSTSKHEIFGYIPFLGFFGYGILSKHSGCVHSQQCHGNLQTQTMALWKQHKSLSLRTLLLAYVCAQCIEFLALPFLGHQV